MIGNAKEINNDQEEVAAVKRRSCGRPRGSKNKPKRPIIITTESPNAIKSHIFEFESGVDIVESLLCFATTRQRGLCVLSATGIVANVTLRQPHGATMVLGGLFGIIIMNGLFFPLGSSPSKLTNLTVYLGRGHGRRLIGGTVVGPLVASGSVTVMATTFSGASYVPLPLLNKNDDIEQSVRYGPSDIPFRKK